LIKLKRVSERQTQTTSSSSNNNNSNNKAKKSDAMIAKFAGGLCFDFNPKDSNMYALVYYAVYSPVHEHPNNLHRESVPFVHTYINL